MRRSVVALGQNGKKCRVQGKDLIPIFRKKHHCDQIAEANDKTHDSIQNELDKEAIILVGIDRISKSLITKMVKNTTADTAIRIIKDT